MLKENELRIGNLFLADGKVEEVENICNGYINPFTYEGIEWNMSKQEPLALTEEWLLKFGFKKGERQSSGYYGYLNGVIELDNDFNLGLYDGRMDDHETKSFYPPIEYVHQLQNLYFALTGEELTPSPAP